MTSKDEEGCWKGLLLVYFPVEYWQCRHMPADASGMYASPLNGHEMMSPKGSLSGMELLLAAVWLLVNSSDALT